MSILASSPINGPARQITLNDGIVAINEGISSNQTTSKKVTRYASYTLAGICSLAARLFFYPISLRAGTIIAGDNLGGTILGNIIAFCNMKSFFILEMWAARGIINNLLGPETTEEAYLERAQISRKAKIFLVTTVFFISIFARYPFALPAVKYNPNYRYIAGGVTLITSLFIPMRSIQMSLNSLYKKIIKFGDKYENKIRHATSQLLHESYLQISNSLDLITATATKLTNENSGNSLFQILLETNQTIFLKSNLKKIFYHTGSVLGLFCTGVLEYAIARYTFSLSKEFVLKNDILAGFFAGLTVLSTTYLYGKSITSIFQRTANAIYSFRCDLRNKEISEQLFPRTAPVLKIEETISNLFALGPWFVIWGDFFASPSSKHWFFITILLTTLFATLQYASLDTINVALLKITKKEEIKKVLNLKSYYESVVELIEKCPTDYFLKWFNQLPENLQNKIYKKAEIPQQEIAFNNTDSSVYIINEDFSSDKASGNILDVKQPFGVPYTQMKE